MRNKMLSDPGLTPFLNTQFTDPLQFLEQKFIADKEVINRWFTKQWELSIPPIYGSVDLRNAGFKVAPIDMNLFPAGFNNLNANFLPRSVKAAREIIGRIAQDIHKILILPESHTRNQFYWSNVQTLQKILEDAGFSVRFGYLGDDQPHQTIKFPEGEIKIEQLIRHEDQLVLADFNPDLILLNNDLSSGIPSILKNITQPIMPPAELGWSQRLKSEHFQFYEEVAKEFGAEINIDPWLIAPLFRHCGHIDFMQQDGLDCVMGHAEKLFAEIKTKYDEYHVPYTPFLVVKADAGTYGMAVMTVRNIEELKNLNRKQRTRMSVTKGGQPVNKVIIQEGVYTFETFGEHQAAAEPVVYLWGNHVVGGFYRIHRERGVDENLNSPGMQFEPIAFPQPCHEPCQVNVENDYLNRFYIYGVIAQLSMLAAAREMQQ